MNDKNSQYNCGKKWRILQTREKGQANYTVGRKELDYRKKTYADDNIEQVMDSKRDYCKRKRYEIKANCKEQIERECDVDVVVRK